MKLIDIAGWLFLPLAVIGVICFIAFVIMVIKEIVF